MYRTVKLLLLIAASCAALAACGGSDHTTGAAADTAISKRLTQTQKSTTSPYATVVEQLYVAYFGRPADPTGLANFGGQLASVNAPTDIQGLLAAYGTNSVVKSLIDSFGTSNESQKLYGVANPNSFVQAVFVNVLGRTPQPAGLDFWVGALNSGSVTYGNAALQIMAGALVNTTAQGTTDTQLINNRIAVALDFTAQVTSQLAVSSYSGSTAAATARSMLAEVNSTTDTTTFAGTVDTTVASLINNVAVIVVDSGADPSLITSIDVPYVSVTICAPSNPGLCQTIDHIQVDTGSYGLRIVSSVLNSSMASVLAAQSTGNTLNECTTFVDGYAWGPVRTVNLQVAGETALNLNMQVIGDPNFSGLVPSQCSNTGKAENTVKDFGSNGLLGVGLFQQDCPACAQLPSQGVYFNCSSKDCVDAVVALEQQVINPISLFANDNNGVIISLPAAPVAGEPSASGTMTFGVNTRNNNALGNSTVFQMDNQGDFTTIFAGTTMTASFIDSGSNGLYFPNVTNIATCISDFYCPSSLLTLSATMQGAKGSTSRAVQFNIGDLSTALNQSYAVYVPLGAPSGDKNRFDWGLPFFFGRNVVVVIDGKVAAGQTGPFVAF